MAKPLPRLSDQQELFVKEYLVDLCASRAALRAGYSNYDYGRELKKKPHVKAAILAAKSKRAKRTNINIDYVVQELVATYEDARIEDEYNGAIRCLELLGKHVGAFQADNSQKGTKVVFIQNMTFDPKVKELPPGDVIVSDIKALTDE